VYLPKRTIQRVARDQQIDQWRPSAAIAVLRQRAELLRTIRRFFAERQVLEVETPALSHAASSEVHLQSLQVTARDMPAAYLHTSPEFAMKRLLAAGSGDIYQICKVFRGSEQGCRHNPEFTLLEWYRLGFDMQALMSEVADLLNQVLPHRFNDGPLTLRYRDAFREYASIDPVTASTAELQHCFERCTQQAVPDASHNDYLDLLLSMVVQPRLPRERLVFLTHFPAAQASLAKLAEDDANLACRFEVFAGGLELANGFEELTDPVEQQRRIAAEQNTRHEQGLPCLPPDTHFLAALQQGLPACSGVALGVDRLVMLASGQECLAQVISFDFDRA
jgi:lysyl-tRNA synthetase class 2